MIDIDAHLQQDEPELPKREGPACILVVDDEPFNVDLLQIELEDRGYKVLTAANAEEALRVLEQESADLALLDVMMPGMDGFELTRVIKEHEKWRQMPIILLTAKGELGDKTIGFGRGADDYLVKPFDIEEVLARIEVQLRILQLERERDVINRHQTQVAMVGAAAHELSQPLAGASGYLQLLQSGVRSGRLQADGVGDRLEQIRGCLTKTRSLADKMTQLESVELEDYACGLYIVNIHGEQKQKQDQPCPAPASDTTLPEATQERSATSRRLADGRVLLIDVLGTGKSLTEDLARHEIQIVHLDELKEDEQPWLVLLAIPDRVDKAQEALSLLKPKENCPCPPVLAVLPTPLEVGANIPGIDLLRQGVDDVLVRPFQMEELVLRIRSRMRLHRLRLENLELRRLDAANEVVDNALQRLLPALGACTALIDGIDPGMPDLEDRLEAASDSLDELTGIIRLLQARRFKDPENEPL